MENNDFKSHVSISSDYYSAIQSSAQSQEFTSLSIYKLMCQQKFQLTSLLMQNQSKLSDHFGNLAFMNDIQSTQASKMFIQESQNILEKFDSQRNEQNSEGRVKKPIRAICKIEIVEKIVKNKGIRKKSFRFLIRKMLQNIENDQKQLLEGMSEQDINVVIKKLKNWDKNQISKRKSIKDEDRKIISRFIQMIVENKEMAQKLGSIMHSNQINLQSLSNFINKSAY